MTWEFYRGLGQPFLRSSISFERFTITQARGFQLDDIFSTLAVT